MNRSRRGPGSAQVRAAEGLLAAATVTTDGSRRLFTVLVSAVRPVREINLMPGADQPRALVERNGKAFAC